MQRRNLLTEGISEEEKQAVSRNCLLCSHNKVCTIFAMFKSGISPHIDESIIKAENLAWICKMYEETKHQ